MGGSAFSAGVSPLHTPRMPPQIYHAERLRCMQLLRQLYIHVDSPIDGPGKTDFGDIDILVFGRRSDAPTPPPPSPVDPDDTTGAAPLREIATLLGAERTIFEPRASSNLAIRWPEGDDGDDVAERHIQVDVRISPSITSHRWMLFKHAHGDIWNLVGSLIRPYGLTVDDAGMYVRIPEIEAFSKSRAKIHLTSDPLATLRFLGLPSEGVYGRTWTDEPFADQDAMCEYAALCRMMYIPPLREEEELNHAVEGLSLVVPRHLKANDRRRMQQRAGFRYWIEEFIPKCRAEGRFAVQTTSRGKVADEALAQFGVGDEFGQRRADFVRERQRDHIWNNIIKPGVPEVVCFGDGDQKAILARSCLVKALKRIILERDGSYGVEFDEGMVGEDGLYNLDKVTEFVEKHQDRVREVALKRHNALYAEHLEKKAGRAKIKDEAKAVDEAKS